jgi:hypothetical protein
MAVSIQHSAAKTEESFSVFTWGSFPFSQNVQSDTTANPASYSVSGRSLFPGDGEVGTC